VTVVTDFLEELGQDFDGFLPKMVKFSRCELHVVEIMQQDVELVIADLILDADAGGSEVGRTGDDRTWFVFVESFRAKNIKLRVKAFGRMRPQFDFLGNHIVNELQDARLNVALVFRALNVVTQPVAELVEGLGRVGQEKQTAPVVIGHDGIHVDANEDANVRNLFQIRPEREISG
jgi:hypothetical protein